MKLCVKLLKIIKHYTGIKESFQSIKIKIEKNNKVIKLDASRSRVMTTLPINLLTERFDEKH